jgi:hypothetical protein
MAVRRWFALAIVLFSMQAFGNPILPRFINELFFGPAGWMLEMDPRFMPFLQSDSLFLATPSDSARILFPADIIWDWYVILTTDSLDHPLRIRSAGDTLSLYEVRDGRRQLWDTFEFSADPGRCSLNRMQGGDIYLDKTPTLGAANDTSGAMGWICGTVSDSDGFPVPEVLIEYDYFSDYPNTVRTDSVGRYRLRALSASYAYWFHKEGHEDFFQRVAAYPESTIVLDVVLPKKDGIPEAADGTPRPSFGLSGNYPNPFNAVTRFEYSIPEDGFVDLAVFDVSGRRIETLLRGFERKGEYRLFWDAFEMPSGIYFCRLQTGNQVRVKKWVVIR